MSLYPTLQNDNPQGEPENAHIRVTQTITFPAEDVATSLSQLPGADRLFLNCIIGDTQRIIPIIKDSSGIWSADVSGNVGELVVLQIVVQSDCKKIVLPQKRGFTLALPPTSHSLLVTDSVSTHVVQRVSAQQNVSDQVEVEPNTRLNVHYAYFWSGQIAGRPGKFFDLNIDAAAADENSPLGLLPSDQVPQLVYLKDDLIAQVGVTIFDRNITFANTGYRWGHELETQNFAHEGDHCTFSYIFTMPFSFNKYFNGPQGCSAIGTNLVITVFDFTEVKGLLALLPRFLKAFPDSFCAGIVTNSLPNGVPNIANNCFCDDFLLCPSPSIPTDYPAVRFIFENLPKQHAPRGSYMGAIFELLTVVKSRQNDAEFLTQLDSLLIDQATLQIKRNEINKYFTQRAKLSEIWRERKRAYEALPRVKKAFARTPPDPFLAFCSGKELTPEERQFLQIQGNTQGEAFDIKVIRSCNAKLSAYIETIENKK